MRYAIYFLTIIAAVALSLAMKEPSNRSWNEEDHSRLIKFTHKFHIQEAGVECETCHHEARTSKLSSDNLLGDHESCKSCHEEQLSGNCGFCHVDTGNIAGIKNPVRELNFSHEKHIGQGVKCETCHTGLADVTYATAANMPAMPACMNCHEKQKVSAACATCHTDFAGLLPKDHLVPEFKKDHRRLARIGELTVTCSTCHTESFCQDCHSGIDLKGFGVEKDLMADPSPRMPLKDTPRETKLQQIHDLNYRFTHSIDAKSKRIDCYSCHERQSFCVECHQAGGNITQDKIRPKNHDEPGFKTIGKGSGGGRHAELAERDIEYCISCHDVEGKDPVCMMCHTENGGVR